MAQASETVDPPLEKINVTPQEPSTATDAPAPEQPVGDGAAAPASSLRTKS